MMPAIHRRVCASSPAAHGCTDQRVRAHEKNLTGSMPARFYVGFLEKTGRNRVAKGCGGSSERLQDARTSSERLRLSRTAKRSGTVVTGRLVKRAQVAHPCKSCQAQQYGYVAHAFVSSASVLLGRRKN